MTAAEIQAPAAAPTHRVRPFFWSVRREIWENRSLYLAPLAVAGVVLAGFLFALRGRPALVERFEALSTKLHGVVGAPTAAIAADKLTLGKLSFGVFLPYIAAGGGLIVTAFIFAIFYALACLHTERRDRSVLFWKSLPVSDRTTVLSKAAIPLVVLPVVTWAVIMALQLVLLGIDTATMAANGIDPGRLWSRLHLGEMWRLIPYSLVVLPLWNAPVIGWLMLVSAWAKRVTFLWAIVPPAALCLFEWVALGSTHIWVFLRHRLVSGFEVGYSPLPAGPPGNNVVFGAGRIDVLGLLANPGLWGGLVVAALCLAACVWLRRRRDPI
jgi:ABC-2 type transport system permease protein